MATGAKGDPTSLRCLDVPRQEGRASPALLQRDGGPARGALGLVLNCVVLWNTRYQDAAVAQLRSAGYPVGDADVARLSPFLRQDINMHGRYSLALPDLAGRLRAFRDPDSAYHEED